VSPSNPVNDAVPPHRDLALAARCRAGAAGAFEELYRAQAPRLFGLACRLVGRPDAEDLLQEIFLAAHRKLGLYKGESSLGTWLYRLATNLCLDHLRFAQATDALDEDREHAPAARVTAIGSVDRIDLERALAALPDGCRTVFVLHDVEGFEHREIATLLGVADGTSKSQLHKARMRLRQTLAGHRPADGETRKSREIGDTRP
jgi:RNA polymerase sigma-70 factor, ECF subfamily